MNNEQIEKEIPHIKSLLALLGDGQRLVISRVGDKLEFTIDEDFI